MSRQKYDQLMDLILKSTNIVALTGAGLSTSAGIPDFRSPKGIYADPSIDGERVFDINVFQNDPTIFGRFFTKLSPQVSQAKPTKGHYMLKKLEDMKKLTCIITQNIDGLHTLAGNQNVLEVHGHLREFVCINSVHHRIDSTKIKIEDVEKGIICPECGGYMKPDIIFFGEHVKDLEKVLTEIQKADLLLIMGTSLSVYPVSGLPSYCKDGTKIVIINQTSTTLDKEASLIINEDIDIVAEKMGFVSNIAY
ncbi:MAG: SIR2 family NAD-dependent protein deacylase [Brevinema sp.]